jgi:hypothetical protein
MILCLKFLFYSKSKVMFDMELSYVMKLYVEVANIKCNVFNSLLINIDVSTHF